MQHRQMNILATRENDKDYSRLNFYEVDQDYIDELKVLEPKIPNIDYEKHSKFMCGVLFEIGELEYFAPISSFSKSQKTNFVIKNRSGKPVGSIRFSFMFPIIPDKRHIKDFSLENAARRSLLIEELAYCNSQARRIHAKAKHVYSQVVSGGNTAMASVCCDFKKLEAYIKDVYLTKK